MNEPFLGMIQYFAFDFAPRGWANCNGQLMSIAQNSALFSLLGTQFGGDGRTTFALPDHRGRSVVGQGNSHTIGETYGSPTSVLLTANMPMHTHLVPAIQTKAFTGSRGTFGNANTPDNAYASNPSAGNMYTATPGRNEFLGAPTVTVGLTGGSQPFNVQNPFVALTSAIALQGIFPSRN